MAQILNLALSKQLAAAEAAEEAQAVQAAEETEAVMQAAQPMEQAF
jgi:hypothetical protein